jgi:multicomponent K+:H+ antiporter subunit E
MQKIAPHPIVSLVLWAVWLALNSTLAPAHLLLGAVLAVALPRVLRGWINEPRAAPRRPGTLIRLAGVVVRDIVVSNVEVARRVLGPEAAIRPAFVQVPLALTDPRAIGALAAIITLTPGTLTADVAADQSHLLVHALHVEDAAALVATIKERYERPLLEIFG